MQIYKIKFMYVFYLIFFTEKTSSMEKENSIFKYVWNQIKDTKKTVISTVTDTIKNYINNDENRRFKMMNLRSFFGGKIQKLEKIEEKLKIELKKIDINNIKKTLELKIELLKNQTLQNSLDINYYESLSFYPMIKNHFTKYE